jgi:hypothetical protein
MKSSIRTRFAATALAGVAAAGLAAPAIGHGDELTLRRDGSQAVPFVAHPGNNGASQQVPVLHRDGSKAVPFDPVVEPTTAPAADGFDWGDAGVGAALGVTAVLVGASVATTIRGRRRAAPKAPGFDGQTASS